MSQLKSSNILEHPWHYLNKENEIMSFLDDSFPHILSGLKVKQELAKEADDLFESVLADFSDLLNVINGVNRPVSFWRIVTGGYLSFLCHYYVIHKGRIENKGNDPLGPFHFKDYKDFVERGIYNSSFLNYVSCFELKKKGLPKVKEEEQKKISLLNVNKTLLAMFLRFYGVYGLNKFRTILISFLMSFIGEKKQNKLDPKVKCNNFIEISGHNKLLHLSIDILPASYKAVGSCLNFLNKIPFLFRPGKLRIASSMFVPDAFYGTIVAEARYRGEVLLGVQHGGNYGTMSLIQPHKRLLEYRLDHFITWGWSSQENIEGNFIALPSPLIASYIKKLKQQKESKNIIYVPNQWDLFPMRADFWPKGDEVILVYKQLRDFFTLWNKKNKTNLVFRPYFSKGHNFDDAKILKALNLRFEESHGDFDSEVYSSKLVILDHPGTTLHIRMAQNKPLILLWPKNLFVPCNEEMDLFEKMAEVGILFHSVEECLKHIEKYKDSFDEWWFSDHTQPVVQEFVNRHALHSSDWMMTWLSSFKNLS